MLEDRVGELLRQGLHCSQIMMQLGLDALELDRPDLVKAMRGLAGGLGGCGHNCGALTGGVCMISLVAGRGATEETADPDLAAMVSELLAWFEETYGSAECADIIQGDRDNIPLTCPGLVCACGRKALEILHGYGFLSGDLP